MTSDNDDHELISFTEFAQIAGIERVKAYQWMRTQDTFPEPVKEVPFGNGTIRYYRVGDIAQWLMHHRPRMDERARERARLRTVVAGIDEEISAMEQALRHKVSIKEQLATALEE